MPAKLLNKLLRKKVRDMDMNLVLWRWSTRTRTRTQTKVLILVVSYSHIFSVLVLVLVLMLSKVLVLVLVLRICVLAPTLPTSHEGLMIKLKKILSPDENFILVLHAVQWSCENYQVSFYTPRNEVRGGILDSPCLSVCLSVCYPFVSAL